MPTDPDELEQLRAENNSLRHLLATSKADCPYCGLVAEDMLKCELGFPGCSRADDIDYSKLEVPDAT